MITNWSAQLSKESLAAWKDVFLSADSIVELFEQEMNGHTTGLSAVKLAYPTIASLMTHQHDKKSFQKQNNVLYRWDQVDSHDASFGNKPGFQLCLKFKGRRNFAPWIIVKQSQFEKGGWGVFACKDFPKFSVVGFYMGDTQEIDSEHPGREGAKVPTHKIGSLIDGYAMHCRNHSGVPVRICISPKSGKPGLHDEMYMGCHFLNDATHGVRDCHPDASSDYGTSLYNRMKKINNCIYKPDGTIITTTRVNKGHELFLNYDGVARQKIQFENNQGSPESSLLTAKLSKRLRDKDTQAEKAKRRKGIIFSHCGGTKECKGSRT